MGMKEWSVHLDVRHADDYSREVLTVPAQSDSEARHAAQANVEAGGGRVVRFEGHPLYAEARARAELK